MMRAFKFILFLMIVYMAIIPGCVVTISQESAQRAIDDARIAIEDAKASEADVYSPDTLVRRDSQSTNIKEAERFLEEAEDALSRNRRQRAYTLATKASEMVKLTQEAEPENIKQPDQDRKVHDIITPSESMEQTQPVEEIPADYVRRDSQSTKEPMTRAQPAIPQVQASASTEPVITGISAIQASDVQSRIKAVIQALDEAEKAVQAARLLMFKTQSEIGLSSADTVVKQVKQNAAPLDVVNLIQSRYDQARKAVEAGKYEEAVSLIEQAQTYAQAFLKP